MALFNKFFQSHKQQKNGSNAETSIGKQYSSGQGSNESLFPFSSEQVRILLYRECDWTGRRLLFDSSALEKINIPSKSKQTQPNIYNASIINSGGKDERRNSCPEYIEIYNGYGYKYNQAPVDANSVGEMIFGAVAMSFKGTSLKVHWLPDPKRIVCSQVFLSPLHLKSTLSRQTSTNGVGSIESTHNGLPNSESNLFSLSLSATDKLNNSTAAIPVDMPSSLAESDFVAPSYAFSGCDSGYSGTDICSSYGHNSQRSSVATFNDDPNGRSSRKLSVDSAILVDAIVSGRTSDGCLQRRILRNMSTSFENNLSGNDFIGYFGENRLFDNHSDANIINTDGRRHSEHFESRSNPEIMRTRKASSKESLRPPNIQFSSYTPRTKSTTQQRRSKIGLAVCIRFSESVEEEMELFCSQHIALLESMLCRLRAAAENAYINKKKFHQFMIRAWCLTTSWITDLFTAPRIPDPVWLSLSNGCCERPNHLAKLFMTELSWLLHSADTKDTNFFISTLLTAILTNHLGWVETVAPIINSLSKDDRRATLRNNQAKMTEISKFHPYNVLWAQLGDLYGANGNPSKLSKTIICGAHTVILKKLLSVLTYFIRCGDVKRVKSVKVMEKGKIDEIISKELSKEKVPVESIQSPAVKTLSRTKTCTKDISKMVAGPSFARLNTDLSKSYAFDVPQQLKSSDKLNGSANNAIKLVVTSPDNDRFECEAAAEAIDYVLKKVQPLRTESEIHSKSLNQPAAKSNENRNCNLLWNMGAVEDGISIEKWRYFHKTKNNLVDEKTADSSPKHADLKRSLSLNFKSSESNRTSKIHRMIKPNFDANVSVGESNVEECQALNSYSSLSDLLVAKKGLESSGESNSTRGEVRFEKVEKTLSSIESASVGNVVFVLGDNDVLSGLKTPIATPVNSNTPTNSEMNIAAMTKETQNVDSSVKDTIVTPTASNSNGNMPRTEASPTKSASSSVEKKKKHCNHKKHSGVKFNFEQYPQIVTNYMKNKNLDITSYDFLEKGLKLEQENAFKYGASSTSVLPMFIPEEIHEHDEQKEEDEEECECCANTFRILQTPSNATELEFSNDDGSYPVPVAKPSSINVDKKPTNGCSSADKDKSSENQLESEEPDEEAKKKRNDSSAGYEVIPLPLPRTEFSVDGKENRRIRPGFVPSLFIGITDHFISDMVLQGVTVPLPHWEPILKQNLTLSSHCATFEQTPTENVAIIANIDKWDVKLASSQTYALSSGDGSYVPIGMSQLVSNMLETVHAMWLAGISAYQCISFLESKLKEIYLQSETLAAFLLTTEFCSLNTVTSTLNLTDNDVPLLLSVASIHSPQLTKKYGISFR